MLVVSRSMRPEVLDDGIPRKRRKTDRTESKISEYEWSTFLAEVEDFEIQHVHGKGKFAFGFVEGPLIKALRSGAWYVL
jgi:midasin